MTRRYCSVSVETAASKLTSEKVICRLSLYKTKCSSHFSNVTRQSTERSTIIYFEAVVSPKPQKEENPPRHDPRFVVMAIGHIFLSVGFKVRVALNANIR